VQNLVKVDTTRSYFLSSGMVQFDTFFPHLPSNRNKLSNDNKYFKHSMFAALNIQAYLSEKGQDGVWITLSFQWLFNGNTINDYELCNIVYYLFQLFTFGGHYVNWTNLKQCTSVFRYVFTLVTKCFLASFNIILANLWLNFLSLLYVGKAYNLSNFWRVSFII